MTMLPAMVANTSVGEEVKLVLVRDGERQNITVEIGMLEDEEAVLAGTETGTSKKLGITVQELTPKLAESLGTGVDHGLIVSDVEPESTAAKAGIRRGDIILEINREKVGKVAQYIKALQAAQEKKSILLLIQRDQNTRFVVIETEK